MPSSLFCLWKSTKAVHNSLSFSFQYNYVILQVRHSVPRQIVRQTVSKKKRRKKKHLSKSNPSFSSLTIYYNSNQNILYIFRFKNHNPLFQITIFFRPKPSFYSSPAFILQYPDHVVFRKSKSPNGNRTCPAETVTTKF